MKEKMRVETISNLINHVNKITSIWNRSII